MAVSTATNVAQRRVVYGANVLIQVVLMIVLAIGLVYLARAGGQVDLTRSGVNSLTPRTEQLLSGLDRDITITAIYTVLSEYDELAQKRQDTVDDLLKLYEAAGRGKVTANLIDPMKDQARLPALLKRLREKAAYRDEAKPHEAALQQFPPLNQDIAHLLAEQAQGVEALLATDPALQGSALVEITQELGRLQRRAADINAEVQELVGGEMPYYGQAIERIREYLEALTGWFDAVQAWVRDKAPQAANLSPDALQWVQQASADYQALLPRIKQLQDETKDLGPIELETLLNQLNRWASAPPILVETEEKAAVVSFAETWPFRSDPDAPPTPDQDPRAFAGEQALSSTILKLTQKEKTAIIFTRFGGPSPIVPDFSQMNMMNMRQMPQAPFGVLNDLLVDENFVTQDWDVAQQPAPPTVPDAARTVYLVFPPTPPPQPDPRRPAPQAGITPEQVDQILQAVDAAGMAVFLASTSEPLMGGAGKYEFTDYLRDTWGITVDHEFLVLAFQPSPESPNLYVPRRPPTVITTGPGGSGASFTDHEISRPLKASTAGFVGVCPLTLAEGDAGPEGVAVSPLVRVPATTDIWGVRHVNLVESDLRSNRGTAPREADMRTPLTIAAAAERAAGGRVVVFGSEVFANNQMLEAPGGFAISGGQLVAYPAYPANADIVINAVHWLTNESNRISVGARKTEVPRLDRLEDGFWLDFWRVFFVGLWPAAALVVGGGVWLIRRR